jgi:hypothetical protein
MDDGLLPTQAYNVDIPTPTSVPSPTHTISPDIRLTSKRPDLFNDISEDQEDACHDGAPSMPSIMTAPVVVAAASTCDFQIHGLLQVQPALGGDQLCSYLPTPTIASETVQPEWYPNGPSEPDLSHATSLDLCRA